MPSPPGEELRWIEAAQAGDRGTVWYLPPYSPDLNPFELAFSKFKGLLQSAGKRTAGALWTFLGKSLDAFAPDECRRYFRFAA